MADTTFIDASVRLNSSSVRRVEQRLRGIERKVSPINLSLNSKKFSEPLGRITGGVDEFNKSLDASNARVIAFGASVGIIFTIQKAFQDLAKTVRDVEKQIADIQVIFNLPTDKLKGFRTELFQIAKQTGQSFSTIADAATEFSRQGLSVAETLERTNKALILTRLSGLDAATSVKVLTAAINTFQTELVTASEVVNRFAAVDAAFAVDSGDLASAIQRSAAAAQGAKVSFNELLAATTAVQERTARGGNVIGNSLKSIFTRIQRTRVREVLEGLGVATTDLNGNLRDGISILKDYASIYDTLTDQTRAYTDEQIAGLFQINNLKALVADLKNDFGSYSGALDIANNTTDEAIRRNERLNDTLAALGNKTLRTLEEAYTELGESGVLDFFKNVLRIANGFFELIRDNAGVLANAFGPLLGGVGAAVAGGVLFKTIKFIKDIVTSLSFYGRKTQEIKTIQGQINALLAQNPQLYNAIIAQSGNLLAQQRLISQEFERQVRARQQLSAMTASLAPAVASRIPKGQRNFAGGFNPVEKEMIDIQKGVGGASKTAKPKVIKNFSYGNGKKGAAVVNTDEYIVKNFQGSGGDAVFNKDMIRMMGFPRGAKKVGFSGGSFATGLLRFVSNKKGISNLSTHNPNIKRSIFDSKNSDDFFNILKKHQDGKMFSSDIISFSRFNRKQFSENMNPYFSSMAFAGKMKKLDGPKLNDSSNFLNFAIKKKIDERFILKDRKKIEKIINRIGIKRFLNLIKDGKRGIDLNAVLGKNPNSFEKEVALIGSVGENSSFFGTKFKKNNILNSDFEQIAGGYIPNFASGGIGMQGILSKALEAQKKRQFFGASFKKADGSIRSGRFLLTGGVSDKLMNRKGASTSFFKKGIPLDQKRLPLLDIDIYSKNLKQLINSGIPRSQAKQMAAEKAIRSAHLKNFLNIRTGGGVFNMADGYVRQRELSQIEKALQSGRGVTTKQQQALTEHVNRHGGLIQAQGKGKISSNLASLIRKSGGINALPIFRKEMQPRPAKRPPDTTQRFDITRRITPNSNFQPGSTGFVLSQKQLALPGPTREQQIQEQRVLAAKKGRESQQRQANIRQQRIAAAAKGRASQIRASEERKAKISAFERENARQRELEDPSITKRAIDFSKTERGQKELERRAVSRELSKISSGKTGGDISRIFSNRILTDKLRRVDPQLAERVQQKSGSISNIRDQRRDTINQRLSLRDARKDETANLLTLRQKQNRTPRDIRAIQKSEENLNAIRKKELELKKQSVNLLSKEKTERQALVKDLPKVNRIFKGSLEGNIARGAGSRLRSFGGSFKNLTGRGLTPEQRMSRQQRAFGAGIGISLAAGALSSQFQDNEMASGALSGLAGGAGFGAMFGLPGLLIGSAGGALLGSGVVQGVGGGLSDAIFGTNFRGRSEANKSAEKSFESFEERRAERAQSENALAEFIKVTEQYNKAIEEGDPQKAGKISTELDEILSSITDEKLLNDIKGSKRNLEELSETLSKLRKEKVRDAISQDLLAQTVEFRKGDDFDKSATSEIARNLARSARPLLADVENPLGFKGSFLEGMGSAENFGQFESNFAAILRRVTGNEELVESIRDNIRVIREDRGDDVALDFMKEFAITLDSENKNLKASSEITKQDAEISKKLLEFRKQRTKFIEDSFSFLDDKISTSQSNREFTTLQNRVNRSLIADRGFRTGDELKIENLREEKRNIPKEFRDSSNQILINTLEKISQSGEPGGAEEKFAEEINRKIVSGELSGAEEIKDAILSSKDVTEDQKKALTEKLNELISETQKREKRTGAELQAAQIQKDINTVNKLTSLDPNRFSTAIGGFRESIRTSGTRNERMSAMVDSLSDLEKMTGIRGLLSDERRKVGKDAKIGVLREQFLGEFLKNSGGVSEDPQTREKQEKRFNDLVDTFQNAPNEFSRNLAGRQLQRMGGFESEFELNEFLKFFQEFDRKSQEALAGSREKVEVEDSKTGEGLKTDAPTEGEVKSQFRGLDQSEIASKVSNLATEFKGKIQDLSPEQSIEALKELSSKISETTGRAITPEDLLSQVVEDRKSGDTLEEALEKAANRLTNLGLDEIGALTPEGAENPTLNAKELAQEREAFAEIIKSQEEFLKNEFGLLFAISEKLGEAFENLPDSMKKALEGITSNLNISFDDFKIEGSLSEKEKALFAKDLKNYVDKKIRDIKNAAEDIKNPPS